MPKPTVVPVETTPTGASEPQKAMEGPAETLKPAQAGGERSRLLRAALAERYADRVIPRGIAATLASELGVSRQRIAQVATAMGWTIAHDPRESARHAMSACVGASR